MTIVRAVAAAIPLFLTLPAQAQKFSDVARALDAADQKATLLQVRATPVHIQISYQLLMPPERSGTLQDQQTAIASAHGALYDMAAYECEQLKRVSPGDCRLVSLNLGNMNQPMGSAGTFQATGTATFEITPPPPPAVANPAP